MLDFDQSFDRLMGHEGGYVNNENDPGGETNWGISKAQYPDLDIKNLTREQAKVIYKRDYWDRCGNILSPGMKFQVFDACVNHGIPNAVRMLQTAVGAAPDGHWGPVSTKMYREMNDKDCVMRFLGARLDYYRRLSNWSSFGRGWAGRIVQNLLYASEDLED